MWIACDGGNLDDAQIPRFGMNFTIPKQYSEVLWYGRGPHENYIDRKSSAFVGLYKGLVEDLGFDYSRPQENGYRTDVRWLKVSNKDKIGFEIKGEPLISFSAHYNSIEDFDDGLIAQKPGETLAVRQRLVKMQRKPVDIPKREFISLNVDLKQMGVGGDNSWGARTLPKYTIYPGNYSYNFSIVPNCQDGTVLEKSCHFDCTFSNFSDFKVSLNLVKSIEIAKSVPRK